MDVPNALIHTRMPPKKNGEEKVIMKITGVLVEILLELDSETCSNHVVFENKKKVIYGVVLKSIYGMLVALLLFYKKFCRDLENIGF